MSKSRFVIVGIILASFLVGMFRVQAQGDESFRLKLEGVLHQFKNYRFSTISVYKIKTSGISSIRSAIQEKEEQESLGTMGGGGTDAELEDVPQIVLNTVENGILQGKTKGGIRRDIDATGNKVPENFDAIYNVIFARMSTTTTKTIRDIYVVTTKMGQQDVTPNTIIAMIATYEGSDAIKDNLNRSESDDIYTYPELIEFDLTTLTKNEYRAENMYELVENAFMQGNVDDVTLAARGIGSLFSFAPNSVGNTSSMIYNEGSINEYDIQAFMRISDGQAMDMYNENQLIVSPDLISWRQYEFFKDIDGNIDSLYPTNVRLPKFGLELAYGIDGINYPSFTSERITASALWENMKMGIILPTNGYSKAASKVFESDRHMTYAGVGIAGEMDFPVAVIPQSGIFHAEFGYVFGDAERAEYNGANNDAALNPLAFNLQTQIDNPDYLIRFNAKVHYTFGIAIDQNYQMRFGLGGTGYTMESWINNKAENNPNEIIREKHEQEFVGGISGEVEFMATNKTTPWGIGVQYFDQSLFTNLWLQIPIIENTFALELEAKGYIKAFADEPHPWETNSIFIPMARFIFNF